MIKTLLKFAPMTFALLVAAQAGAQQTASLDIPDITPSPYLKLRCRT